MGTYDTLPSGISDLQFLPTIPDENGEQVSIAQNIFPGFGDPDNGFEFDYEDPEIPKTFYPFMLPHYLSHVDKPVVRKLSASLKLSD